MILLVLSQENLELSVEEALALLKPGSYKRQGSYLLLPAVSFKRLKRLALTRYAFELIGSSTKSGKITWDIRKRARGSGAVRFINSGFHMTKKRLFIKKIMRVCGHRTADLQSPDNEYVVLGKKNGGCHIGTCLWKNTEDFRKRRAHLKPELLPISMNPRLARTLVNLTGITRGTLIDPFCGVGGILVEGGLMNLPVKGFDIDSVIAKKCRRNLSHYHLSEKSVVVGDGCTLLGKERKSHFFIATEPPFGKNTKQKEVVPLYSRFLTSLVSLPSITAAISFPSFYDPAAECKKLKLNCRTIATIRVHRSMSKRIVLVSSH